MIMLGAMAATSTIMLIMGLKDDDYNTWDVLLTVYLWLCFLGLIADRILF